MNAGADAERKRVDWRCRRGMRELDVLLGRYLAELWPAASAAQRRAFAALLDWPDPELAALLFGRRGTTDPDLAAVVAACRGLHGDPGGGPAGEPPLLES